MAEIFTGFDPKALAFFGKLAKNNDRDWFKAHKSEYDTHLKDPMLQLLGVMNTKLARFAPDHVTEPKKAIYRIYRDTRFSKNKIPLKVNISAMFGHHLLPKNLCAGYYFHISATEVAIGVGLYGVEPDQLKIVRQAIANDPATFKKLVADKKVTSKMGILQGDALTRVPKGFDAEHPAAAYLKMKQFYFFREVDPTIALSGKIVAEVANSFERCAPFAAYLNRQLLALHQQPTGEPDAPKRPMPMF